MVVLGGHLTAFGQWPPDDGLAIGDRTAQQSVPKVRATDDGGCYISWFDNASVGYDVYLQHLDAAGNEVWPHNGVRIAERAFTWTQDYGLAVDTAGNAVMAFLDDIEDVERVCANRISPDGTLLWGIDGVQLSGPGADVMSPRIAATNDGGCMVGWTGYAGSSPVVKLQKLDADGIAQWNPVLTLSADTSGGLMLSDMQPCDDGSVIVSFVFQGPQYYDPRHLWAQKVSSDGTLLWDPAHVIVYDGGTLQFGNFPRFVTDGAGGAVFAWYQIVGNALDCATQRILADGSEFYDHNGVVASTLTAQYRVSPSVAFNAATGETFMFWNETDTNQVNDGVYAQKLSGAGKRDWGEYGKEVVPLGGDDIWSVQTVLCGDGAIAFWLQASSFGVDKVRATRLDGNGDFVWSSSLIDVTPTSSNKSRIDATSGPGDVALAVWMDDRDGDGDNDDDIYAQNMFPNGTMGTCLADLDFDGDVDLADLAQLLANYGMTSGAAFEDGDLDGDGDIDLTDLGALLAVYGGDCY
jgi:hypothetical protein